MNISHDVGTGARECRPRARAEGRTRREDRAANDLGDHAARQRCRSLAGNHNDRKTYGVFGRDSLHHIAFSVKNLESAIGLLESKGGKRTLRG